MFGAQRGRQRWLFMTSETHKDAGETAIEGARREWRHTGDFNGTVKSLVVVPEAFVMRAVARLVNIQQRDNQAGPRIVTTYAACGLNVFRVRFGLPQDDHQTQPRNIETH